MPRKSSVPSDVKPPSRLVAKPEKRKGAYKTRAIVEFPVPLWDDWEDPVAFADALDLHMRRHGDTAYQLRRAVCDPATAIDMSTFKVWRHGLKAPRGAASFRILTALERRWRLPAGYFRAKLVHPGRMISDETILPLPVAERRRIGWHLPDDFAQLPLAKRREIVTWVQEVIVSGATSYRRYHAEALRQRFALQFSVLDGPAPIQPLEPTGSLDQRLADSGAIELDRPLGAARAPAHLDDEASDFFDFKTATLSSRGRRRNGVWNAETADQKMDHLGLMFGALAASPTGDIRGYGAPLHALSFGLLVFPAVWDWYLTWRERRRGFYTQWETEMLTVAAAISRRETGWLRQTPQLAGRLRPIQGLVSAADVQAATDDWDGLCDVQHSHVLMRAKEIARVARVHRDPFEPVLAILEAESPVGEYRKITEEILRRRPDAKRHPMAAAEATRAFLMLRLGLHLGLRQKNLRELLVRRRGQSPTPERQLEALKRGELRWSSRDDGWEVLIPAAAFKNSASNYFRKNPFRLILPDLGGLYRELDAYIDIHRAVLLRAAPDPGVLFVKTIKAKSLSAAYNRTTFYEAWRTAIQRYGIYNPYTGQGAIEGLLPHGPHNARDVLATHILKQTGSYEQASYAIQDTPDTIAEHYGRFLPQDKAALAAQVLNQVWAA